MVRLVQPPNHAIAKALATQGGQWVDLPMLLPAAVVLELAGEQLRPRLVFAETGFGTEICLRPDLTLPAALEQAKNPTTGPVIWLQAGTVFRLPQSSDDKRGPEHFHLGIERFGEADKINADIQILRAAYGAIAAAKAPLPRAVFCDAGLAALVIGGLDIPAPWRDIFGGAILAQDFSAGQGAQSPHVRTLLAEATGANAPPQLSDFERQFIGVNQEEAADLIWRKVNHDGLLLGPNRSIADVASRILAKVARAGAGPLPSQLGTSLLALLSAQGPIGQTLDKIFQDGQGLGLDLTDWRNGWEQRLDGLYKHVGASISIGFESAHNRNFGYYDGMTFDLYSPEKDRPKAWVSGGRYDGLLARLGGVGRPAVGAVVRTDHLAVLS